MKRILGLAALLCHALGAALPCTRRCDRIQPFTVKPGGRGANKRPVYGDAYYSASRPKAARWWHDINNPAQGLRFDAAVAKRERKAEKLKAQTLGMWNNKAHTVRFAIPGGGTTMGFPARLNPFYQRPVTE